MKKILFILLFLPCLLFAQQSLRLPSVLSDHMLLQQNSEVKFWGWCDPRTTIKIIPQWSKDTIVVKSNEKAKWETTMKTPEHGGPYTIKVLTKDKNIMIKDVLIGELWLCSGQSNMEYNVEKGVLDSKEALQDCANNKIRFFFVPKATADYPQDDCMGYWKVCDAESMRWFSSVGYFFGEKLNDVLKVPVGLINSNWGGTPAETWTPEKVVVSSERLNEASKSITKSTGWDITIGSTYNAMIYPMLQMKIAGVIWYQGEANCQNAYTYSELLTSMIQSWREKFQANLPFYYVQIAPYLRYPIPFSAAIVREQQEKVQALENTGMVVISDQVDELNNIHPKYKKEVGNRLANYALAVTYGKETPKYRFATFKEQKVEKQKIRVYFNDTECGIIFKGDKVEGLEIAGNDHIFYAANGKIDKKTNSIIVESKEVKEPKFVRYAFGNGILGNLFDKTGLPLAPFRTDEIIYNLTQPEEINIGADTIQNAGKVKTKPTEGNVHYGLHERQVLDFYQADSDKPTPLVIWIHGGGWVSGDKKNVYGLDRYLEAGISVVSINYRYTWQAQLAGIEPPVKWPLEDAARALQFVRSKAGEWNIDKERIAASGSSAGATSSLYLAFHEDMADPNSNDPIARESTRLLCAGVRHPQTTLDPKQMIEWTPNSKYGGHAFGFMDPNDRKTRDSFFKEFLNKRQSVLRWIKMYSPYEHVSSDDPDIYMLYLSAPEIGRDQKDPTHTANFGVKLQEHCQEFRVDCELVYPDKTDVLHKDFPEFIIEKLTETTESSTK